MSSTVRAKIASVALNLREFQESKRQLSPAPARPTLVTANGRNAGSMRGSTEGAKSRQSQQRAAQPGHLCPFWFEGQRQLVSACHSGLPEVLGNGLY